MAKKQPNRTERRSREHAARKLVRNKERLAKMERGGARDHPIEVVSSAVISIRAAAQPCPLCDGRLRLDEEIAETARLRAVRLTCARCGAPRQLWFAIGSPLAN